MNYRDVITIEPGKRGGKPCIRGMRVTVYDVLEYLASGMTQQQILHGFPYLAASDIQACLAYAPDRERMQITISTCSYCLTRPFHHNNGERDSDQKP